MPGLPVAPVETSFCGLYLRSRFHPPRKAKRWMSWLFVCFVFLHVLFFWVCLFFPNLWSKLFFGGGEDQEKQALKGWFMFILDFFFFVGNATKNTWHKNEIQSKLTTVEKKTSVSGQVIIFHQAKFPRNKGISLTKPPFGVRSCEVAIIWPDCLKCLACHGSIFPSIQCGLPLGTPSKVVIIFVPIHPSFASVEIQPQ